MRTFASVSLFATLASAAYKIQDDYTSDKFASMFNFFTDYDPTNGYVNYVNQGAAQSSGLYKVQNNQVYMGVDSTNVASGRGRDSIRVESKKSYNHGLIILDLAHMPASTCGTWPAFWLLGTGATWPQKGEIDIIEGVNLQKGNSFAGHTTPGCSITSTGNFAGSLKYASCDINAGGQPANAGCAITSSNDQSFGTGFNSVGGGVYATEWTSKAISIWHFPRSAIPADITSGSPNPDNWGLPTAQFTGGCDIDKYFKDQQIIFDITFCGDWAGNTWGEEASCKAKAATCGDFVKNNPGAFKDTFWTINSLKVYQDNGAAVPTPTRTTRTLAPTTTPGKAAPPPPPTSTTTPVSFTTTIAITTSVSLTTVTTSTTTSSSSSSPPPPPPTTTPSAPPPPPSTTSAAPPPPTPTEPSGPGWHHWGDHDSDDHPHKSSWGGWGSIRHRRAENQDSPALPMKRISRWFR